MNRRDADLLSHVAPGVFDHEVNATLVAEFLRDPRHHLVVGVASGQIVGFVSALHYIHPDKPAEMWINEVGVAPDQRQHGLGRSLLQTMLALARELGCANAWVLADADNDAAMRLYRGAGGVATRPVMFEFPLGPGSPDAR